jgi:hypothetical protein
VSRRSSWSARATTIASASFFMPVMAATRLSPLPSGLPRPGEKDRQPLSWVTVHDREGPFNWSRRWSS